jgi:hypothetical protein
MNIKKFLGFLFLLSISSCAISRTDRIIAYHGPTIPFKNEDVEGWQYDLVSMNSTFSIHFTKGGYAPATIGMKNVMAAPAYQWRIDENQCLTISDDERITAIYQLIKVNNKTVSVWNKVSGSNELFTRQKKSKNANKP